MTELTETPLFFESGGHDLFGIFTEPTVPANGMAVLSLWGGNEFPTSARNQVRNRLAAELAAEGFHVLRIDYRGIGESAGLVRTPDLTEPWDDDIVGAVAWLAARGFDQVLVTGTCFGARSALAGADRMPNLAGLLLASFPVGTSNHREAILEQPMTWYVKRALSFRSVRLILGGSEQAKRRRAVMRDKLRRVGSAPGKSEPRRSDVTEVFLDQLRDVLERGVPIKFIYGSPDDFFGGFERSLDGPLGELLTEHGIRDEVTITDIPIGSMHSLLAQDTYVGMTVEWMRELAGVRT